MLVQVRGSSVTVVEVVLSRRVAVAQSWVTVSGQCTRYQKESVVAPDGIVNVWAMLLSPLVAATLPTRAA